MSLLAEIRNLPIAFVDVETTGASPDSGDRVIEVGIARYEGGVLVATYSQLVNPNRSLSPVISALTGITGEMLEGQPTFKDVQSDVLAMLKGTLVGGHNIPFDLAFLRNEFRKCTLNLVECLKSHHVVDTVRLARRRFGKRGNGLQNLAERLELRKPAAVAEPDLFSLAEPATAAGGGAVPIPDLAAHRALPDAIITARLFERLIEPPFLKAWSTQLVDLLQTQGGPIPLGGTPGKSGVSALPFELEEALDQRVPIQLHYLDATDTPTTRVVTPMEIRKFRGHLILLAFCSLRQEKRSFKLSRILHLSKPPELDPDTQLVPGE